MKKKSILKRAVALISATAGMLSASVLCINNCTITAMAAEQTEQGYGTISVKIRYDNDIIPQEGDEFVILYCIEGDESNTAEITLDASQIYEDGGQIQVPYNTYSILDINYRGANERVPLQGYAVSKGFHCDKGVDGSITIAIGDGPVSRFEKDFGLGGVRVKDGNHNEWGEPYREYEEEVLAGQEVLPITMEEFNENQANKNENTAEPVASENESEPDVIITDHGDAKIEDYRQDDEDKKEKTDEEKKADKRRDALSKLGVILVFAIIGSITILVLHKKGKI